MAITTWIAATLAPLWTWVSDGEPLRLGLRVPRAVLQDGLSLHGRGQLQWRRLPVERESADEVWIEVAICAPSGTVKLVAGGVGPTADGRGCAFVRRVEERRLPHGHERVVRWEWCDGTVDAQVRTTFTGPWVCEGDRFGPGEAWTRRSAGLVERARWWRDRGRAEAARCGLLPKRSAGATTPQRVRRRLAAAVDALVEMPGLRGAGDFRRADGEVTNLEYDTTYALLRCAVATGHRRALRLALRCADQLRDRDLDQRTGLPFVHGDAHRTGRVEAGHAWLRGLLWVGLLAADDGALAAARALGRALSGQLPRGVGRGERLRDFASPLLELEALLRVTDDVVVARAADRLGAAVALRFDRGARVWRFGEGEEAEGGYFERAWLTAGLLLPALVAHHRRVPAAPLRHQLDQGRRQLLDRIGRGARGLPTHYRSCRGRALGCHYEVGSARSFWVLEALSPRDQRRLLARANLRRAAAELVGLEDPDLPTAFTMVARCDWVWR